jgi:hypothetical protein
MLLQQTHVLSTETAKFPNIVLDLPYWYVLSNLPWSFNRTSIGGLSKGPEPATEKIIQISQIVALMQPQDDKGDSTPLLLSTFHTERLANDGQHSDWTQEAACMNPTMLEHRESVSYLPSRFMSTLPALTAALESEINSLTEW